MHHNAINTKKSHLDRKLTSSTTFRFIFYTHFWNHSSSVSFILNDLVYLGKQTHSSAGYQKPETFKTHSIRMIHNPRGTINSKIYSNSQPTRLNYTGKRRRHGLSRGIAISTMATLILGKLPPIFFPRVLTRMQCNACKRCGGRDKEGHSRPERNSSVVKRCISESGAADYTDNNERRI